MHQRKTVVNKNLSLPRVCAIPLIINSPRATVKWKLSPQRLPGPCARLNYHAQPTTVREAIHDL